MTNVLVPATPSSLVPTPATTTTWDGSTIPGAFTVSGGHTWTADATGLYTTSTNLAAEWKADYTMMLQGKGDQLDALQRLEGNAESVMENTGASKLSATRQGELRQDLQREFDAIWGAMKIDQARYGIDPGREFNSYTYLKLEQTLQSNEKLLQLGYQGHGLNDPVSSEYDGYTTDFQNRTDNKTYFVGGGADNGEKAIADFTDDVILSHAPFPSVMKSGVMEQLNQNSNPEDTVTDAVGALNEAAYSRVFVASDFSTDPNAQGAVVYNPHIETAPPLPTAGVGQELTLDGSVLSTTISSVDGVALAHTWTADDTGLYHTGNLQAEWQAAYDLLQSGGALTPMQRMEANAQVVINQTGLAKLSGAKLQALREDAQREFDAIWASMQIDQARLGISDAVPFTDHTYLKMEQTLQGSEAMKTLAIQGHGLNGNVSSADKGYTETFQNRVDNTTLFVGPGLDHNESAVNDYFDDVIMSHAPFPAAYHNGTVTQLNQNGDREDSIKAVVAAENGVLFTLKLTAGDFSKTPAAG